MIRTALYARYSTDLQSPTSIEDQFLICREQAAREKWQVVGTYRDEAISGESVVLRSGVRSLLEDAQLGRFDVIMAEALDRLSRDLADVATLYKHLQFAGVKLVTLAEGEINELHIGLKGTMNSLFLKDLSKKTRRGIRGRVEKGKSGGGLCYGYDVVKKLGADGEPLRGERAINEAEAEVVRRIFRAFSTGKSPRAIAIELNAEGIPGPFGKEWADTTIRGHRSRRTGIIHNELYVGQLVWNRQRYIKNPATGKRVARINPESEWVRTEVPELRILDDDLWTAAQDRVEAIAHRYLHVAEGIRAAKGRALNGLRRPVFLFSGMIECGVCGGNCPIVVNDRFGCSAAFRKKSCSNSRTIRREVLESRALAGITERLVSAEAVKTAVSSYIAEINAQNWQRRAQSEQDRRSLEKVERGIAGLLAAIEEGLYQPSMKARMIELEEQKAAILARMTEVAVDVPDIHPNVAEVYGRKVERLVEALDDPALRDEAADDIRSLVGKIVISPGPERGEVHATLSGELGGILRFVSGQKPPGFARSDGQGQRAPASHPDVRL